MTIYCINSSTLEKGCSVFVVQFQPQRKYQMEGISTRATLYYDVYIQLHIDVLDKFLGPHTLVLDVESAKYVR